MLVLGTETFLSIMDKVLMTPLASMHGYWNDCFFALSMQDYLQFQGEGEVSNKTRIRGCEMTKLIDFLFLKELRKRKMSPQ